MSHDTGTWKRAGRLACLLALTAAGAPGDADSAATSGGSTTEERPGAGHGHRLDRVPRWLVITAMQSELDPFLAVADIDAERVISGRTYYSGRLAGVETVLLAGGVSMVNAAMSAQEAIHHYTLRGILMAGIAGGVRPEIAIGSVTVPAQWAEYQEHAFTEDPEQGRRRGLGNFGMMYPGKVRVTRERGPADVAEPMLWFPADDRLLAAARRAMTAAPELERCNRDDECVEAAPWTVIGGNGVSGPTFVDHAAYRDFIWATFEPDVLDMESAAVAHVAYSNELPYLAIRSLSDLAGGGYGSNRMRSFGRLAARNAAAVTIAVLSQLAD